MLSDARLNILISFGLFLKPILSAIDILDWNSADPSLHTALTKETFAYSTNYFSFGLMALLLSLLVGSIANLVC